MGDDFGGEATTVRGFMIRVSPLSAPATNAGYLDTALSVPASGCIGLRAAPSSEESLTGGGQQAQRRLRPDGGADGKRPERRPRWCSGNVLLKARPDLVSPRIRAAFGMLRKL